VGIWNDSRCDGMNVVCMDRVNVVSVVGQCIKLINILRWKDSELLKMNHFWTLCDYFYNIFEFFENRVSPINTPDKKLLQMLQNGENWEEDNWSKLINVRLRNECYIERRSDKIYNKKYRIFVNSSEHPYGWMNGYLTLKLGIMIQIWIIIQLSIL
jgi:hypothetical protein